MFYAVMENFFFFFKSFTQYLIFARFWNVPALSALGDLTGNAMLGVEGVKRSL